VSWVSPLGVNLAHQNVALLDAGADANHARFVQIAQTSISLTLEYRVTSSATKFRIARLDFVFFDMQEV